MTQDAPELDARAKLLAFAAERRLTLESTFIPYSQSENAKPRQRGPSGKLEPWPSLNWRVRLMVQPQAPGGAAREVLATSYSAGIGYAPAMQRKSTAWKRGPYSERRNRDELAAWEIENGYPAQYFLSGSQPTRSTASKPIAPDLCDVLASLALDASVLDSGGFEDWAADLGYDTDSRAAEAIYRACLEIALKLRAALGDDGLRALRDASQDY